MSQLLCEQVVGRGLRRSKYELNDDGKFSEEVSKVLGVPFEVIPFKANPTGPAPPKVKRYHVHAVPEKEQFKISYPRVEGYTQGIRNRVTLDWETVPPLTLEPGKIPPEIEMKGLSVNNRGRFSLQGPGKLEGASLAEFRSQHTMQKLVFELAASVVSSK
jgi:type III restriction enzyme